MTFLRAGSIAFVLIAVLVACQSAGNSTQANENTPLPGDQTRTLTPFNPTSDTPPLPTITETAIPPTLSPTPSTPVICDPNAPNPPTSAHITGVTGYPQAYSLSCEARSAVDLADFWGVTMEEGVFFSQLPKSENPDTGFVGSVTAPWGRIPPESYGVHAAPVAALMRQYGIEALAHKDLTFRCLQQEIAAGRPVLVWIVGHAWAGAPVPYVAPDGEETTVALYEHTMILIGYDESSVYLVDAFTGSNERHLIDAFLLSWAALDNMALTVTGADPAIAAGMQYAGGYYEVQDGDSLLGLAEAWSMDWDRLAALNGIVYPFRIYPGQVLKTSLPLTADSYPTPTSTANP